MTLNDALTLTAGDIITRKAGAGFTHYKLTSVFPARPEMGYAPGFVGHPVQHDGTLARHITLNIVLDGSEECNRALAYWSK